MSINDVVGDIGDGLESYWNNLTGKTAADAAKKEAEAQAAKIAEMKAAAGVYGDYRQQQQQARMNALSSISTAYQPANNALATMYGGGMGGGSNYNARPAGYAPITAGMSGKAAPAPVQTFAPPSATAGQIKPAGMAARNPLGNKAPFQSASQTLSKMSANPALAAKLGAAAPAVGAPKVAAVGAAPKTPAAQPGLIASQTGGAAGLDSGTATAPSLGAMGAKMGAAMKSGAAAPAPMMALSKERGLSSVGGVPTPGQQFPDGSVTPGTIGEDGTYYTSTGIHYGKPIGPGGNGSRSPPPISPGMSIEEANAAVPERFRRNLTGYGNEVKEPGQGYYGQYWVLPPGGDPNDPSTWVFVDEQYLLANKPEYEAWLVSQGLEMEPNSNYVLGAVPRWGAAGSWAQQGDAAPGGGGGGAPTIGAGGPGDPTSQYRTNVNPNQPAFIPNPTGPSGVSFQPTEMLNNPFGNVAGAGNMLPFDSPGSHFRQAEYYPEPPAQSFAAPSSSANMSSLQSAKAAPGGNAQPAQSAGQTLERLRALSRGGVLQKFGQGRP